MMDKDNLTYMEEVMKEAKQDEAWDAPEEVKEMMGADAPALAWILLDL